MTGAKAARLRAGMTLEQAARRLRWSVGYLREIERRGAPWTAAVRLAALYNERVECFRQQRADSWLGSQGEGTGPGN
ncbi:MAG TPA: helix-turn-helix transcriptional regulator [Armatimonadota bacterium]|jgi:transcriptional regulator with XRE-family HTH domain